jgi:hypothetical protein
MCGDGEVSARPSSTGMVWYGIDYTVQGPRIPLSSVHAIISSRRQMMTPAEDVKHVQIYNKEWVKKHIFLDLNNCDI